MKARAGPTYNHGLLLVSAVWVTLLCWGELRYARWLQGRSAAFLASFSLVAANVIAKTLLLRPEFLGEGVWTEGFFFNFHPYFTSGEMISQFDDCAYFFQMGSKTSTAQLGLELEYWT